jgi:hypothetical protein
MKLSPQKQKIIDYLKGGEWKCMASAGFFIKDDRKRISELKEAGYEIDGKPCDKRCGTNHSSGIFMRKLVNSPMRTIYKYALINGVRVPQAYQVPA